MAQPSRGTKNQVTHLRKDIDVISRHSNFTRNLLYLSLVALAANFLFDFLM